MIYELGKYWPDYKSVWVWEYWLKTFKNRAENRYIHVLFFCFFLLSQWIIQQTQTITTFPLATCYQVSFSDMNKQGQTWMRVSVCYGRSLLNCWKPFLNVGKICMISIRKSGRETQSKMWNDNEQTKQHKTGGWSKPLS